MENINVAIAVEDIINQADKFRGAYFFSPPSSAGGRRSYEKYNSRELVSWADGGSVFTAKFVVDCSCRNVYAHGEYTRDGRKTTLAAIKNSFARIQLAHIQNSRADETDRSKRPAWGVRG